MAFKTNPSSVLALLLVAGILLVTAAGRSLPGKKQPEWLVDQHDGSLLIPGVGRIMLPPLHGHSLRHRNPMPGGSSGVAGAPRSYIPGGDDTFVPNPGAEVPIPGTGSGAPISPLTGRP